MREGLITYDQQSEQWHLRQEGVHPKDWLPLMNHTKLTLFVEHEWIDGVVRYSPDQGRYYFLDEQETLAVALARDLMARCPGCGGEEEERASLSSSRSPIYE